MIVVALVLVLGQQPARDTRPIVAAAGGTLSGTVTSDDAQSKPLRRARVTLNGQALDIARTVITADDGSFVFEHVPPGRFTVTAAKDGYVSMTYGATRTGRPGVGIQIADRQSVRIALRLPRGAVITGTVADADGQPASGILVFALARRFVGGQGEFRYLAAGSPNPSIADDRGVYRVFGLPAGDYFISAQAQTRQVGNPGTELRTMSRGQVIDRPVALSQVFHPSATDIAHAVRVTAGAGEERSGVDVQLQYVPLTTISGTAPAVPGSNPATLTMVRTDEVPGFDPVRSARADAAGRFTIPAVPPGQYKILARSTQFPAASRPGGPPSADTQFGFAELTVAGEDIENVVLSMQPPVSVAGEVRFEGETPPAALPAQMPTGLPLFMTVANAGFSSPSVVLDGSRFKLDGVAPGAYRIQLTARGIRESIGRWWLKSIVIGGRDVLDRPIELQQTVDDAVVTFTDRASEISGILRDAQGAPAREAYVVVFSTDRSHWFFNSRRVAGFRPLADGRWFIRNLPPGEYRVVAADLEPYEWFDPAVLDRLTPSAGLVTISGVEKTTQDLVIRDLP